MRWAKLRRFKFFAEKFTLKIKKFISEIKHIYRH